MPGTASTVPARADLRRSPLMNTLPTPTSYQMALTVGDGTRLEIQSDRITGQDFYVIVSPGLGHTGMSICIEADQAPAVALAILRAAGVKPSASIEPRGWQQCVEVAAGHLDDAILLAERDTAAAELTRRRDNLARTVDTDANDFEGTCTVARTAIDMIIQLQDEAAK